MCYMLFQCLIALPLFIFQGKGSRLENSMSLTTIASSPHDYDLLPHCSLKHRVKNSPINELDTSMCDNLPEERTVGGSCAPVKFLGDDDQDENDMEVFQLTEELDLEQIENHWYTKCYSYYNSSRQSFFYIFNILVSFIVMS